MPAGRPTDYKPEFCEMLIEHMSKGLSFESFAGVVGSCRAVLYDWERKHKEFLDAKRKGTDLCLLFYETNGVEGMWDKEDYDASTKIRTSKKLNDRVWRLNMANRFGWRENQTLQEKIVEKRLIIQSEPESKETED